MTVLPKLGIYFSPRNFQNFSCLYKCLPSIKTAPPRPVMRYLNILYQPRLQCGSSVPVFQRSLPVFHDTSFLLRRVNVVCIQNFHLSASRCALGPYVIILFRPISKIFAVIFGRIIRSWWRSLPAEKKESYRKKLSYLLYVLFGLSSLLIIVYILHIEEDAFTHRNKFILFGEKHMKEVARIGIKLLLEEMENKILPCSSQTYMKAAKVLDSIVLSNNYIQQVQDTKWSLMVVDDPSFNAYVFPNGTIIINTGMIDVCDSVDSLAVIISHEMAHVLMSHMAEQMSNGFIADIILTFFAIAVWAIMPDLGAAAVHFICEKAVKYSIYLPFSRKLETEADELGLKLSAKACYDPNASVRFWSKMSELAAKSENSQTFEWMSTHPCHETRIENFKSILKEAHTLRDALVVNK